MIKLVTKSAQALASFGTTLTHAPTPSPLKNMCTKVWQGLTKSFSQRTFSSVAPQAAAKEMANASSVFSSKAKCLIGISTTALLVSDPRDRLIMTHLNTEQIKEKQEVCSNFATISLHQMTSNVFHPMASYAESPFYFVREFLAARLFAKLTADPTSLFKEGFKIAISPSELSSFIEARCSEPAKDHIALIPVCTVSIEPESLVNLLQGNLEAVKVTVREPWEDTPM